MGLTEPPTPGSTEVEEVRRERALEKLRIDVEGRKKERDLELVTMGI